MWVLLSAASWRLLLDPVVATLRAIRSAARLRWLDDDRVALTLRRPRRGTRELVFEPTAFVARLAALLPPPRWHMTRFFGALASGSSVRRAVIPEPPDPTTADLPVAPKRPRRMRRVQLLRRVFFVEPLSCPCGGTLRSLGIIRDPDIVQAILAAIVPSNPAPAHAPPARSTSAP